MSDQRPIKPKFDGSGWTGSGQASRGLADLAGAITYAADVWSWTQIQLARSEHRRDQSTAIQDAVKHAVDRTREHCAKLCEDRAKELQGEPSGNRNSFTAMQEHKSDEARFLAEYIRGNPTIGAE